MLTSAPLRPLQTQSSSPPHFGIPGSAITLDYQKELGHAAIDAGATVVGTHPHVMQGIELYRGHPIFYSLGNFIFELPAQFADRPYSKPHLPSETMFARWTVKNGDVSDLEVLDYAKKYFRKAITSHQFSTRVANVCRTSSPGSLC